MQERLDDGARTDAVERSDIDTAAAHIFLGEPN